MKLFSRIVFFLVALSLSVCVRCVDSDSIDSKVKTIVEKYYELRGEFKKIQFPLAGSQELSQDLVALNAELDKQDKIIKEVEIKKGKGLSLDNIEKNLNKLDHKIRSFSNKAKKVNRIELPQMPWGKK